MSRSRSGSARLALLLLLACGPGPTSPDDPICGSCVGPSECAGDPCLLPNLVVIVLDDADVRDFAFHDPDSPIPLPSIDALAADSLVFDRFYASAAVCSPTRAALQSGNHPARYGINHIVRRRSRRGLPPTVRTIAEQLRSKGYATAHIGKWHLGEEWHKGRFQGERKRAYRPSRQGYDFTVTADWDGYFDSDVYVDDVREPSSGAHLTERFTDHALAFLREHGDRAFFLGLNYFAPHEPLEPPPSWASRFPDTPAGRYEALSSHMDHQIGRVLQRIRDLGLWGRTAIWLTSDNGGARDVHPAHADPVLRGHKGTVFEGGIRSPLLVRWPGLTPAASRTEAVAATMDLLPTIVDLLGDDPSRLGVDGESFAAALRGEAWQRSRPLVWHHFPIHDPETRNAGYRHDFAVREGRYKLVGESGVLRLFNLDADPRETQDLSRILPGVASDLLARYAAWRLETSHLPVRVSSITGNVARDGDGFAFSGPGRVTLEEHPSYDFDDGEFSVRLRVRPGRPGSLRRIVGRADVWLLRLDPKGRLELRVRDGATGRTIQKTGATPLREGDPYDVALSFHNHAFARAMRVQVFLGGALEIEARSRGAVAFAEAPIRLGSSAPSTAFVGGIEGLELRAGSLTEADLSPRGRGLPPAAP